MEHDDIQPPQLPRLHFGRTDTGKVAQWLGDQRDYHDTTTDSLGNRYWPKRPNSVHIRPDDVAHDWRNEHYRRRLRPVISSKPATNSRTLVGWQPLPAHFHALAHLPVLEQLAWVGILEPTKCYQRPERLSSWLSLSDDCTVFEDEKFDEKNEKKSSIEEHYNLHPSFVTTHDQLLALQAPHPVPSIPGERYWKSLWYHYMTVYKRLMLFILVTNITILAALSSARQSFSYPYAATATGANLLASVLMRQEHVINILYHLTCALPRQTPLTLRRVAAKLAYNNGGIHAGAAIGGLIWYISYAALLSRHFHGTTGATMAVSGITATIVVLLAALIALSHPSIRRRYHNFWELSHRYGGWIAIALVWVQMIVVAGADARNAGQSVGRALLHLPLFYFLIVITCCLLYPWLRIKRLTVNAEYLSAHATQLRFADRSLSTSRGVRLARNPFRENHGFATIPKSRSSMLLDPEKGYSILVSNAGDFTNGLIHRPPRHIWLRGAPTIGIMRLATLFRPIVIVATGSGIGPCLSFLNVKRGHPMRVIWSARCPELTFGYGIIEKVLKADDKAVIVDTQQVGCTKVDLVSLAFAMVKDIRAEAVMVISNPKVTRDVVYGMEMRGIAAFGAVFDS
ncbi:hypothetical protein LTR10_008218 [Elasticomyces elasticus]|nr:hypothetical protein LTR10_008218 [Elasticomyces elasticus]KAK4967094.1 hypothetical protein LTR42_010442 [Elasticomyces elasticus]